MLAVQRHREILNALEKEGAARVADLARRLKVTEETVRRDLDALEDAGQLVRSHGGAVLAGDVREIPIWLREREYHNEKRAIAREALKRVKAGDTLFLDASSTAGFLAKLLPDIPLTVLTNSLQVALALSPQQKIRITVTGGTLFKPSLSFLGPATERALRHYHADKLFLSAKALDIRRGLSDANEQQAALKRVMLEISDWPVLMMDHSKFGMRAPDRICGVDAFKELITDDRVREKDVGPVVKCGVRVTRAAVP